MISGDLTGIAPPGTYDKVLELVRPLPGRKILDVPCGAGGFAALMSGEGAICRGMDIMAPPDNPALVTSDMNVPFPFDTGAFDVITCVEGVEHAENIYHVTREFYRLLAPGGKLVITTPNVQSLRSRLKFLVRGTFFWFDTYEIRRIGHVNFIPFFLLRHALARAGFEGIALHAVRNAFPALPAWACRVMRAVFSRNMREDVIQNSATLINAENLAVTACKP